MTRTGVQCLLNNVAHLLDKMVEGKLFTDISSPVRLSSKARRHLGRLVGPQNCGMSSLLRIVMTNAAVLIFAI